MNHEHAAVRLATGIADQLAHPDALKALLAEQPWRAQSLAHGAPGVALLHIELAATGTRPWRRAHDWLTHAAEAPVTSGPDSHLHHGAPALAHALTCANAVHPGTYARALHDLDAAITVDANRRVKAAHRRIDQQEPPALAEYDAIRGLTGIGSHLLRRDPDGPAIRAVLEYLVRLTHPLTIDGETLPGWWTTSDPSGRRDEAFPGGHANNGIAHGITGPLALLALATLQGVNVAGQDSAITIICGWLDQWRVDDEAGATWPYWVTRDEIGAGRSNSKGPRRPSWCYGTAGLARAQQLAALATADPNRQRLAENALINALDDPAQLAGTADMGLCHGVAGMAHVAARVAADAAPDTCQRLHVLASRLLDALQPPSADPKVVGAGLLGSDGPGPGFLEGTTGIALAALVAATGGSLRSGWDSCLLIISSAPADSREQLT